MKKVLLLFLLSLHIVGIHAQDNKEWRKKFIAFTVGRTFYLHKPIANMLRFGIDATWFDLNYTNYDIEHITYWETNKYQYHQGEVSMQVGPSLTFEPIKKLSVHAYFKYAPTFAVLYTGNENILRKLCIFMGSWWKYFIWCDRFGY